MQGVRTRPGQNDCSHVAPPAKTLNAKTRGSTQWTCVLPRVFFLFYCNARFFEIFLAHFAQIFRAIKAVEEENAVEMVYFVLQNTGIPAFGAHTHRLATYILPLDDYHSGAADVITRVAGDAQAAFGA